MIKHLFKLIWNRKKNTSLLMIEILLSFLVLFAVLAIFYYNYSFYAQPTGFDYKNVWVLQFNWNTEEDAAVKEKIHQLDLSLKNFNEIENYSFCSSFSFPYSRSMWSTGLKNDNGIEVHTVFNSADTNFTKVLGQKIIEGRWFNKEDDASTFKPVIINNELRNQYFGENAPAIGEKIIDKDDEGTVRDTYTVIGIIDHYKYRGEFEREYPLMAQRMNLNDTTLQLRWSNVLLVKVKQGANVAFEENLVKHIVNLTKGWKVKVSDIDELRNSYINQRAGTILVSGSLAFILLLNVALGLMGVIWYSINRRKSEIGLRRATGASGKKISLQIIGEAIVLGTFAIIIGILFAVQVPILKMMDTTTGIMLASIVTASVFIYILITICSLYPSFLASRIQPAEALHDE